MAIRQPRKRLQEEKALLSATCKSAKIGKNCPQNKFGNHSYPMPLDYSTTAIDRWTLPEKLFCPPLYHLHNILNACFRLKTQPTAWNAELLITLPKPGQDARFLSNTRGITLSCIEGKLLLTTVDSF
ncbi:hypothetical protein PPACK8108_LOCUS24201 [Phakopsora pachyrhizi]|uniref:Uncharacterized protein n=1 Tax=Phakopsora pachyrhizi TaxID=170000 RepID=A0AAV0BSC3_PHAPC|nr:hypothetical protein PPACK8108_LOCUS24201 [Phakopsora pachyrhizi]